MTLRCSVYLIVSDEVQGFLGPGKSLVLYQQYDFLGVPEVCDKDPLESPPVITFIWMLDDIRTLNAEFAPILRITKQLFPSLVAAIVRSQPQTTYMGDIVGIALKATFVSRFKRSKNLRVP